MKMIIVMLSLLPTLVLAENIDYECEDKKSEHTCTMYANSNFLVSAIEFHIKGDVINFEPSNDFQGDYDSNSILLYTDSFKEGRFEIGKITYKGKLKETYLSYGDESFQEVVIYNKENNHTYYYIFIPIVTIVILFIVILLIKRRKSL